MEAKQLVYWMIEEKRRCGERLSDSIRDDKGDWVAQLDCGHGQHMRHDPQWTVREWVTTEEGRASHIGMEIECKRCDE